MNWNNGTIFRVYVAVNGADIVNGIFNVKVNINQQLLNGKVFMGVENLSVAPLLNFNLKRDYWASIQYIQLSSINLPPYIDFSAYSENIPLESRNTTVLCRFPVSLTPSINNAAGVLVPKFGFNNVFNKDSILCEMLNNQNALANGNLQFKITDTFDFPLSDYIEYLAFTLIIYKPNNKYN